MPFSSSYSTFDSGKEKKKREAEKRFSVSSFHSLLAECLETPFSLYLLPFGALIRRKGKGKEEDASAILLHSLRVRHAFLFVGRPKRQFPLFLQRSRLSRKGKPHTMHFYGQISLRKIESRIQSLSRRSHLVAFDSAFVLPPFQRH